MEKDIVEVLDSQTANTQSEPTTVITKEIEKESEQTDIALEEIEEIKTEVAHTCKNKCDSCEFEYKERSYV